MTIEARLASAGSTPIGWFSLVGGENVVAAAREVPLNATAIPSASEMSRGVHALSGAPKIGETVVNCSGVALLKKPAHGEPIILAEINGLTITRNS